MAPAPETSQVLLVGIVPMFIGGNAHAEPRGRRSRQTPQRSWLGDEIQRTGNQAGRGADVKAVERAAIEAKRFALLNMVGGAVKPARAKELRAILGGVIARLAPEEPGEVFLAQTNPARHIVGITF